MALLPFGIDVGDPIIFAVGVGFGVSAVTVFRGKLDSITKKINNAFVGTRHGKRLGLKRI